MLVKHGIDEHRLSSGGFFIFGCKACIENKRPLNL